MWDNKEKGPYIPTPEPHLAEVFWLERFQKIAISLVGDNRSGK